MPRLLALVFTLALAGAAGAQVQVGAGSYLTTRPSGGAVPSNAGGVPVEPLVTDAVTRPVPTNDWWTSLVWSYEGNRHSETMYAHPLALRARAGGLGVSYPAEPVMEGRHYAYPYREDLVVGLDGLDAFETRASAFSDWTVTARWEDQTAGAAMEATFGHGLPFVYVATEGSADTVVRLSDEHEVRVWHHAGAVAGVTVGGRAYGLFAPTGATWARDGHVLRSDLGGHGYFSVAALPDAAAATLETFRRHAYAFVTGTRVDWQYDEPAATLTTTFTAETAPRETGGGLVDRPLVALYRHQWLYVQEPMTALAYASPRGTMRVRDGASFTTVMPFGGVLPMLPSAATADVDRLYGYVDAAFQEGNLVPRDNRGDTYWTGKAMLRLAHLVRLADLVDHTTAHTFFLAILKSRLQDWLRASEGETSELFYYDATWHTLLGHLGSFNLAAEMNDHHFHYGYFVMAAATVAQYDPAWAEAEQYGGMIELIAKDVANAERDDARFPFLRSFDPYAGHSWASGHGIWHDDWGNNQEASSEAVNFAAALVLWGSIAGDDALRDLGIFLYAHETRAAEQYWFDVDDAVFPKGFDHLTVGRVWGSGGDHATWFSQEPEAIHGINYLPFTGGSLYLGRHPDYVRANFEAAERESGGRLDQWYDLFWSYLALSDPDEALRRFADRPGYDAEYGESKAHTYHWLHAVDALGHVDTTVTADVPTYAVFAKAGTRTHVAYNPTPESRTVIFSSGTVLEVPPYALADDSAATTGAAEPVVLPEDVQLLPGAPNPFRDRTRLSYRLPAPSMVYVDVFDAAGRRVRVMESGQRLAGLHTIVFDGRDLPAGLYLLRMQAEGQMRTQSVVRIP